MTQAPEPDVPSISPLSRIVNHAVSPYIHVAAAGRRGKKLVMDALAASDGTHALDVEAPPVSDTGARPQMKRQGSVSVDAAYRAMPTHHTPTEYDAKGSSGQSAWAGVMPDAAAAPPTPVNRASKWPGWKK